MKETKINLSAFEVSEESLLMSGLYPGQPAVVCTGEEEDWPGGLHPSHPVTMAHPETATQASCQRVCGHSPVCADEHHDGSKMDISGNALCSLSGCLSGDTGCTNGAVVDRILNSLF